MKLAGKILLILLWMVASSGPLAYNFALDHIAGEEQQEQVFEETAEEEEAEEKSEKKEKDPEMAFSVLDPYKSILSGNSKYYFYFSQFSSPFISIYSPPPQFKG